MPHKTAPAKPLRYHLRFQVLPGPNVERDAEILAAFCKQHGIEEAVLFYNSEEWNTGLLSRKEEDRWFDTIRRAKAVLDKAGIVSSLNPWITVLHRSQGRTFPKDRKFRPMVSPTGEESKACGSFADPVWRDYIWKQYGRFARLGLRVLWVEDDFRYHNHSPLTWGGGFEPEMLDKFAAKVGRPVTREQVLRKVLKPGAPHPWRKLWLETWGEAQLEVAAGLAQAVKDNAPAGSKLGLMSGIPAVQSAEGRNWPKLLNTMCVNGQGAHRPHFYGSHDGLGRDLWKSIMLLDLHRSLTPDCCEIAPELESYPFTRWGRSDRMNWAQMALCLFLGSDALLLDLFPFSGNPADREPAIGEMLDGIRPGLEWIAGRFTRALASGGVGAPWRQDASHRVQLKPGEGLNDLAVSSASPCEWLLKYGVPVSARLRRVNAVFGRLAWAFDDAEVNEMLRGGLILDAESAQILFERGFGREIGVSAIKWLDREEGTFSIEIVARPDLGAPEGHYLNAYRIPGAAAIRPARKAQEWTTLLTPEKRRVGAGMTAFENRLGGRVVVQAFADPGVRLTPSFQRQALAQSAVAFASAGDAPPMVTGGAYLLPVHLTGEGRSRLVVLNGAADPARPVIRIASPIPGRISATVLRPLEKPAPAKLATSREGGATVVKALTDLPAFGFLVVEW